MFYCRNLGKLVVWSIKCIGVVGYEEVGRRYVVKNFECFYQLFIVIMMLFNSLLLYFGLERQLLMIVQKFIGQQKGFFGFKWGYLYICYQKCVLGVFQLIFIDYFYMCVSWLVVIQFNTVLVFFYVFFIYLKQVSLGMFL